MHDIETIDICSVICVSCSLIAEASLPVGQTAMKELTQALYSKIDRNE